MNILVKFPSRGRPEKFLSTLKKYVELSNTELFYLFNFHNIDYVMNSSMMYKSCIELTKEKCYFIASEHKSKINAFNDFGDFFWNNDLLTDGVAKRHFDIILLAQDDMIPQVQGYDEIIIKKMQQHFPDTDGALWFHDGFQDKLNTQVIIGKKYYDRFGYLYHPSYQSLWCDNEFQIVADKLGKMAKFPECIIRHEHPDWNFGKYQNHTEVNFGEEDEGYRKTKEFEIIDYENFARREKLGFPINE